MPNRHKEKGGRYKKHMTRIEFENLWNRDFAGLPPLAGVGIPNFEEFIRSERMRQDYLDIFRGENTREGDIEMPYDHPFFDENGNPILTPPPLIKYILVLEAIPPSNPASWNNCLPLAGDKNNSYIFDITHVRSTPYLSQPRVNWGCPNERPCPENKKNTLLCLASKGVYPVDLFPFPIPYGPVRLLLNTGGVTRFYWDNLLNPFSIVNQINAIGALLSVDWDLCLMAPCTISEHIVNPINGFPPLAVVPAGSHPINFRNILPDPTRCALANQWRKVAVSSAGFPTAHLINVAF